MRAVRWMAGFGALVWLAGCTPVTGRQARLYEEGAPPPGTLVPIPDVSVSDLVAAARTLPGTERRVVETALAALDATGPQLDCSNFVVQVYATAGVDLPRTVREQLRRGVPVDLDALQPGDLVFFAFAHHPADHVGIYAGRGRVVHVSAATRRVQLAPLGAAPFVSAWAAGRRVCGPPGSEPRT
jgi:cell wall-associated NlpC family hydrolase